MGKGEDRHGDTLKFGITKCILSFKAWEVVKEWHWMVLNALLTCSQQENNALKEWNFQFEANILMWHILKSTGRHGGVFLDREPCTLPLPGKEAEYSHTSVRKFMHRHNPVTGDVLSLYGAGRGGLPETFQNPYTLELLIHVAWLVFAAWDPLVWKSLKPSAALTATNIFSKQKRPTREIPSFGSSDCDLLHV